MKRFIFLALFISIANCIYGQGKTLKGVIYEEAADNTKTTLPYVNVHWAGTQVGVSSNHNGIFEIPYEKEYTKLVISFVGFVTDTLEIGNNKDIDVVLRNLKTLEAVEIIYRRRGTEISMLNPINVQNINKKELRKAACCNLAESFETNASVDASYTNAITGRQQIKMLGLDGKYVQILEDNIPYVRGLASYDGLEYLPGAWVNSIQVSKAAGSVVNGYESITGQINTSIKSPENSEKFHLNLYSNLASRLEGNINYLYEISEKVHGTLLVHAKDLSRKIDNNNDGFIDNPLQEHLIIQNSFKVQGENTEGEFSIKGTFMDSQSGQLEFSPENLISSFYGVLLKTNRWEAYSKTGYIFPNSDYASFGLQLKGVIHENSNMFGNTKYSGKENALSANLIYQDGLNDMHKFKAGVSMLYDKYDESLTGDSSLFSGVSDSFIRTEKVPGAFFEYTLDGADIYNVIAGIRIDEHNIYGTLINPRIHARYSFDANTALKLAAGKGQRVSNVLNENMDILASNRRFFIHSESNGAYGLNMEEATTVGINLSRTFEMFGRDATFLADYYNTNFTDQVVMDLDRSAQEVHFYNLDGKSYSNSFQLEFVVEPIKRFEVRIAGRWMDVKTDYLDAELDVPFNADLRGFLNIGYVTRKNANDQKWLFDATLQSIGEQRLPSTLGNPEIHQRNERTDPYGLLNAQITREISKDIELYIGAENLLDYKQGDAIISSSDPYGTYFDANYAYAPVFGRNVYFGLRYTIPASEDHQ